MAEKNMNAKISVEFEETANRQQLSSGDNLPTLFGKIKKFFTDLKPVAMSGSYNDLDDKPEIPTTSLASEYNDGLAPRLSYPYEGDANSTCYVLTTDGEYEYGWFELDTTGNQWVYDVNKAPEKVSAAAEWVENLGTSPEKVSEAAEWVEDLDISSSEIASLNSNALTANNTYFDGIRPIDSFKLSRFAVCATDAASVAKSITLPGDILIEKGTTIIVKFDYGNTVALPTLSINGGTAYRIYNTSGSLHERAIRSGRYAMLTFSGTAWELVGNYDSRVFQSGRISYTAGTESDQIDLDFVPTVIWASNISNSKSVVNIARVSSSATYFTIPADVTGLVTGTVSYVAFY